MRIALPADYDAIERIAHDTMLVAWPGKFFPAGDGKISGFPEQITRPGVLLCCADDVSAFILSERLNPDRWMVRFLMPLSMPAATGRGLIGFAMQQEQKARAFKPTTECFARLSRASAVEQGTRDAYKLILTSGVRVIADTRGVARADEIFMLAPALAVKLGVALV